MNLLNEVNQIKIVNAEIEELREKVLNRAIAKSRILATAFRTDEEIGDWRKYNTKDGELICHEVSDKYIQDSFKQAKKFLYHLPEILEMLKATRENEVKELRELLNMEF